MDNWEERLIVMLQDYAYETREQGGSDIKCAISVIVFIQSEIDKARKEGFERGVANAELCVEDDKKKAKIEVVEQLLELAEDFAGTGDNKIYRGIYHSDLTELLSKLKEK